MKDRKEPLYRKINTRTHGIAHRTGGEARWARGRDIDEARVGAMHAGQRNGLDYTPLFRFLLSRVGRNWDEVYAEAVARLDRPEPIFWLVAQRVEDRVRAVRLGENSYFSGLFVDDDNRLALVDPSLSVNEMEPGCACCTHTLNGVRFTKAFVAR